MITIEKGLERRLVLDERDNYHCWINEMTKLEKALRKKKKEYT